MKRSALALVAALAFGLLAAPLAGGAQPAGKVYRIGLLRTAISQPGRTVENLREGLRELGWVEGQNVAFEIRNAEGRLERLPKLAAELVQLKVDVVVTSGPPAIRAAMAATRTIPIVMGRMDDADAHGFVTSLARPGGNVTGLSFQSAELSGKWLELLREAVPQLSRVAILWDPTGTARQVSAIEDAARSIGIQTQVFQAPHPGEYEKAFEAARRAQAQAVAILASPVLSANLPRLAELAAKGRLPAVYYHRDFAGLGGLMAYGPRESEFNWRRAAIYVDKILRGAKPADLPVEQPREFELVVNLNESAT